MAKTYDPLVELKKRVAGRKQRAFAQSIPCSQSYLSEVISGKKGMNDDILGALGLERIYVKRKVMK